MAKKKKNRAPAAAAMAACMVEDEWQLWTPDGNRHVFYRPEDVRAHLQGQLAHFAAEWKPESGRTLLSVEVMHVVRHRHVPDDWAVARD